MYKSLFPSAMLLLGDELSH